MAPLTISGRRLKSERGAELIEMALVLPLLLLIIVGIVDFGFLFRELSVVTNAAREGARAGVLPDYGADQNVVDRVQAVPDRLGDCGHLRTHADCIVNSPVIDVTAGTETFQARNVSVTIFHNFTFLGPISALVGGSFTSVPLTGRSVMRRTGNIALGTRSSHESAVSNSHRHDHRGGHRGPRGLWRVLGYSADARAAGRGGHGGGRGRRRATPRRHTDSPGAAEGRGMAGENSSTRRARRS